MTDTGYTRSQERPWPKANGSGGNEDYPSPPIMPFDTFDADDCGAVPAEDASVESVVPGDLSSTWPRTPTQAKSVQPLSIVPWGRDPTTIPARQFLYGNHYIRGACGSTIGGGGRGKTTLSCVEAVSMAVGAI